MRPAPSATTWPDGRQTSIGSLQQACQKVILRRIHGEPRLCERGMDTNCSSAKCGRARLPRTRVVCVAVTDPADGSLRWCILRPPRTWEAGRTSNPRRLRAWIHYGHRPRAWGPAAGVQNGAQ